MKTISVPEQDYPVGIITQNFPQLKNGKFTGVEMTFTRVNNWPGGVDYVKPDGTVDHNVVLVARMEFTNDGLVWNLIGEAPFVGGLRIDRSGNPITIARCSFAYSFNGQPVGKSGAVRAWFNVLAPITTAVTATAYEEGDI